MSIAVRTARLDDTAAMSALAAAQVAAWQRLDADGRVQDVPYSALSVYERWLHGGPWMSVETGAIWLGHLLRGGGVPLVAHTADGAIVGYAEVFPTEEAAPLGRHLHLASLHVAPDAPEAADALLAALPALAAARKAKRVSAQAPSYDGAARERYTAVGMSIVDSVQRASIPARTGQVFYKATEHADADPAQIAGWQVDVGRSGSARHLWETHWPRTWDALPELREQRVHRLCVSIAGQDSFVLLRQQLYDPRAADWITWTQRAIVPQLVMVVRDWAHREGYRALVGLVNDNALKALGPDAEVTPYREDIYAMDVR